MSVISDAMRRTQADTQNRTPPPAEPWRQPDVCRLDLKLPETVGTGEKKVRANGDANRDAIAIGLILVAAAVMGLGMVLARERPNNITPLPATAPNTALAETGVAQPIETQIASRPPQQKVPESYTDDAVGKAIDRSANFRLTGILRSGNNRLAVINNSVLQDGDRLLGARLEVVHERGVTMSDRHGVFHLSLTAGPE